MTPNAVSHRPSGRRAIEAVAVVFVLLACAVVATVTAPTDDEIQTPIVARGVVGETVTARQSVAEVNGVELADEVTFGGERSPSSSTTGVWVVVDITTTCRLSECSFTSSELRLGPRTFGSATIAPTAFEPPVAAPGLAYRGELLFEIPLDALDDGVVELAVQGAETVALDSVPVVRFLLPREIADQVDVSEPELVGVLE